MAPAGVPSGSQLYREAGRITRPHGIRGELRARLHLPDGMAADGLVNKIIRLTTSAGVHEHVVIGARSHGEALLLTLQDVSDRTAADSLAGAQVALRTCDLPELADGEFYLQDLIGAEIHDIATGPIGQVRGIAENGAQSLLSVAGARGEQLLPLVPAVVRRWDAATRVLTVLVPAGLWDD